MEIKVHYLPPLGFTGARLAARLLPSLHGVVIGCDWCAWAPGPVTDVAHRDRPRFHRIRVLYGVTSCEPKHLLDSEIGSTRWENRDRLYCISNQQP
jgi:hypothetical protein